MNHDVAPSTVVEPTRRVLQYWVKHWDWECPTLFGLELDELCAVLRAWPNIPAGAEEKTLLAIVGAYRELLYGASAVSVNAVESAIGVTYEKACQLLDELAR